MHREKRILGPAKSKTNTFRRFIQLRLEESTYREWSELLQSSGLKTHNEFAQLLLVTYRATLCNTGAVSTLLNKSPHGKKKSEETNVNMVEKDIVEEQQPSEDLGYQTYRVKEEDLEEDWTVDDPEIPGEPQSTEELETETDTVYREDPGDGWTEDRGAKEVCEEAQPGEGVHRGYHTDSLQEEGDWTVYIKEEPLDNDCTEDDGADLQTTTQSSRTQGGYSSLNYSIQSMRCSQQGPSGGVQHLDKCSPSQAELGTQSDSSGRERSEYCSSHIANHMIYGLERSIAEREISGPGSSYDKHGGMNTDRERECDKNSEMSSTEDIGQSTQHVTIENNLSRPMKTNKHEELYQLSVCDKELSHRDNLKTHRKPYQCFVCNNRFTQKSSLKTHMRTHTREEPYPCTMCDTRFIHRSSLLRHLVTHTREKPFKCSVCNKGFVVNYDLKRHMKTHAGEILYKCSACNKSFTEKRNLIRHMRTHTGKRPYHCSVCFREFFRNGNLKEHMKSHVLNQSIQSVRSNRQGPSGGVQHINEYSPSQAELGTQSDSSRRESSMSENCSSNIANQEQSIAERETSGFESSYDKHRGINTDRERECDEKSEISLPEDHRQSTQHVIIENNLSRPMKTNEEEESYQRSICDKELSQGDNLKTHRERPYQCSVCNNGFTQKSSLKAHMRTHTREKPYPCTMCDTRFIHRSTLLRHLVTHTGAKPFKCSVCNKGFVVNYDLKMHMKTHTGEKPHQCSVCNKSFTLNSHLIRHMRTHPGKRSYHCSVCFREFFRNGNLKEHMKTHVLNQSIQSVRSNRQGPSGGVQHLDECSPSQAELGTQSHSSGREISMSEYCPSNIANQAQSVAERETSGSGSSYHRHGGMNTDRERACYEKSEMSSTEDHGQSTQHVTTESNLSRPMQTNKEEESYQRSICDKELSQGDNLETHRERPYQCSVCNNRFTQKSSLKAHMRTHTREQPYPCTMCDTKFRHRSSLLRHLVTHTREKPFKCSVCNKGFVVNYDLKMHMKTHTGEKPHRCSVCNKSFAQSSHLITHTRTHTGEKPHQCTICDMRFTQKSSLSTHMVNMHIIHANPHTKKPPSVT